MRREGGGGREGKGGEKVSESIHNSMRLYHLFLRIQYGVLLGLVGP